ncbi:hypothetical protein GYMLUDRAFT_531869 [Collybiopsis luxurians FD-317 M1]|nr:hypothetical protein GYMLUDRAFT_531869 [Collybiopsis luxurians FD-317 M1]
MPQPIADAAHIAPYHTHAASPHGQSTLTSFEGAGRVRQAKSKKNKPSKAEKSSRRPQNENASCTTFPNFQRANDSGHPNPSHPGPLDYIRNSESSRFHGQRHPQEIRFSDVPNYPPPSFQEAMSSPPLSVCPSTTAFGFHSCSGRSVPAPPPVPFGTLSQRHSPASILDNSDTDSDESDLEIVDDQRNSRQSENCTQNRSRALLDDTSALSVPKRRHMSLSPLRTLFPHKPIALQNRALSAQSTSPYSFPKNASFFRSTASLKTVSTGSFFRLPLSAQSSTSLVKAERKGLLKGKDRLVEPLESWEVLGPDSEHYPSLMSAVESLTNPPSPDSGTSSPTQSHTPVHEQFHSSVVEFNSPSPGSIRTTYNLSPSSLEAESRGSQPEALPMPSSRSATLAIA